MRRGLNRFRAGPQVRAGSQNSLGGGNAGGPRVAFHRLPQSPGRRLEDSLDDMMAILAVMRDDMQVEAAGRRRGPPKLLRQRRIERAQSLPRYLSFPRTKRPAAQ